jgi:hypothetical protein
MKLTLLTYGTGKFRENCLNLAESAYKVGFHNVIVMGREDIEDTQFYRENSEILTADRGAGYWLWKPYLINKILKTLDDDEVLLYSDAGRTKYYEFSSYPSRLVDALVSNKKGVLLGPSMPHLGRIANWTKRECLLKMDADTPEIHRSPLLMTWSLWQNTDFALAMSELWLKYCRDLSCIGDQLLQPGIPNHAMFKEHRTTNQYFRCFRQNTVFHMLICHKN